MLIGRQELANRLGISVKTLSLMLRDKNFPRYGHPEHRFVRFNPEEVISYLKQTGDTPCKINQGILASIKRGKSTEEDTPIGEDY